MSAAPLTDKRLRKVLDRGLTPAGVVELAAQRTPGAWLHFDRPMDAFPEAGTRIDYATLARLVRGAAGSLAEAGVKRGDRVAIVKRNHVDVFMLAAATFRLGAVPALFSPRVDPVGLAEMLRRLQPDAVLTDMATWTQGPLAEIEADALPGNVLLVDGSADGAAPMPPAPVDLPPPAEPASLDDTVVITHTSGTTGVPKLVVQPLRAFAEIVGISVGLPRLLRLHETVGVHLAFSHWRAITGASGMLLSGFNAIALTDDDPDIAGSLFEELRPGLIESHPNSLIRWQGLAAKGGAFDNVRFFSSTFDAVHPHTIEQLLGASKRRNPMYVQMYGQTESGPITFRPYTRRSLRHADGRCVGWGLPRFSKFRIAADGNGNGNGAGPHEGPVQAKSPARSFTYLGQDGDYESKLHDGWWDMTDVGLKSRWGCLHLLDRSADKTEHVHSLLETEDALLKRLPALAEVVLIPMSSGPPVPIVCTHGDGPFDADAWRRATADMPVMRDPMHVEWNAVPRTGTSKVRRFKAREMLDAGGLEPVA